MMKKRTTIVALLTLFLGFSTGCRNVPTPMPDPEPTCEGADCLGASSTLEMPTNIQISNIGENSAVLTWDDPNFIDDFAIEIMHKKAELDTFVFLAAPGKGTGTYAINGLDDGTTYDIRLQAVSAEQSSGHTFIKTFTTLLDGGTPPPNGTNPAAENLVASVMGVTKNLVWNYSNSDFNLIDAVQIQRKAEFASDGAYVSVHNQNIPNGVSPITSYADSDNTSGNVVYRIHISYEDGTTAYSNVSNAVAGENLVTPVIDQIISDNFYSGGWIYRHRIYWDSYSSANFLGYEFRSKISGEPYQYETYTVMGGTWRIIDPGCDQGDLVTYEMRALAQTGGAAYNSDWTPVEQRICQ